MVASRTLDFNKQHCSNIAIASGSRTLDRYTVSMYSTNGERVDSRMFFSDRENMLDCIHSTKELKTPNGKVYRRIRQKGYAFDKFTVADNGLRAIIIKHGLSRAGS